VVGFTGWCGVREWEGLFPSFLCLCSYMGKGEVRVLGKKRVSDVGVVTSSVVPVDGSPVDGFVSVGWWGRFRLLFVEGRGVGGYMSFGGFVIFVVEVLLVVVFGVWFLFRGGL
jgi:hypothetical protein